MCEAREGGDWPEGSSRDHCRVAVSSASTASWGASATACLPVLPFTCRQKSIFSRGARRSCVEAPTMMQDSTFQNEWQAGQVAETAAMRPSPVPDRVYSKLERQVS